jgi:hypothetical protein
MALGIDLDGLSDLLERGASDEVEFAQGHTVLKKMDMSVDKTRHHKPILEVDDDGILRWIKLVQRTNIGDAVVRYHQTICEAIAGRGRSGRAEYPGVLEDSRHVDREISISTDSTPGDHAGLRGVGFAQT